MSNQFEGSIQLASKGKLYNNELPDGIVKATAWGTAEERIFVSPSLDFDESLDRVIKQSTDLPFDPSKLLLVDKQHLFLYMRCLSYGGDYSFSFACENCGSKVTHSIDLENDLDTVFIDDKDFLNGLGVKEITEPFRLKLPLLGKEIGWRMLRGSDEKTIKRLIAKDEARSNKSSASGEGAEYLYRLALRIVDFDGKPVDDILEAIDVLRLLKGKDLLALRQDIQSIDFGVKSEFEIKCTKCGYTNTVLMPLDKSFFSPKRRTAHGK